MITYHQNNIAAFKGAHIRYNLDKGFFISATSGAPPAPGEEVPFMEGTRGLAKELAQSLMGSMNGI